MDYKRIDAKDIGMVTNMRPRAAESYANYLRWAAEMTGDDLDISIQQPSELKDAI